MPNEPHIKLQVIAKSYFEKKGFKFVGLEVHYSKICNIPYKNLYPNFNFNVSKSKFPKERFDLVVRKNDKLYAIDVKPFETSNFTQVKNFLDNKPIIFEEVFIVTSLFPNFTERYNIITTNGWKEFEKKNEDRIIRVMDELFDIGVIQIYTIIYIIQNIYYKNYIVKI